jgi:hypothetical protein
MGKTIPDPWEKYSTTSYDCLTGFLHRHKFLSPHEPESRTISTIWVSIRSTLMQSLTPVKARQKGAISDHLQCAWDWTHNSSMTKKNHSMQGRKSKLTKWYLWNGEHLLHCVVENSIPPFLVCARDYVQQCTTRHIACHLRGWLLAASYPRE